MPFATGSELQVGFAPETTFGQMPAAPAFQLLRTTGGGIDVNKTTGVSDEIRPDRNTVDEYLLGLDFQGQYGFELTYGTLDALLAAAFQGSWSGDVLKNGTTLQSFAVEEALQVGQNEYYSRFVGVVPGKFDLTVTARKPVTGSVALWAVAETTDSAALAGATYTAGNAMPVLTSSANVAALTVGTLAAPKVKSLSLAFDNNMRVREVVGDVHSQQFGSGQFDVTGTMEAYFENNDLYNAVLAHGGGALSFTVGAAAGQKYTIKIPNLVFLNGKKTNRAKNTDVMVNIPFRGRFDPASGCSAMITRNVQ